VLASQKKKKQHSLLSLLGVLTSWTGRTQLVSRKEMQGADGNQLGEIYKQATIKKMGGDGNRLVSQV
jgi:hypothetical protein